MILPNCYSDQKAKHQQMEKCAFYLALFSLGVFIPETNMGSVIVFWNSLLDTLQHWYMLKVECRLAPNSIVGHAENLNIRQNILTKY